MKQYSEDDWQLKRSPLSEADFADLPEKWSGIGAKFRAMVSWIGAIMVSIWVYYNGSATILWCHTRRRKWLRWVMFLVQGYGHRRWQLGKWCDPNTAFKPNQPIRIFDDMGDLIFDEVMAPLIFCMPSRLSHYGVAQDDCLTFSFGLRYPNLSDLLEKVQKGFCHQNRTLI